MTAWLIHSPNRFLFQLLDPLASLPVVLLSYLIRQLDQFTL
jgi:hypothetical protein